MWSLLERTKELAAKMEHQLNEAAGIDIPTSKQKEDDDALNDAWNDDFDDDAFSARLEPESLVSAAGEGENIPRATEDGGSAWDDEINFDDSVQDAGLQTPIQSKIVDSQLDRVHQSVQHLPMDKQESIEQPQDEPQPQDTNDSNDASAVVSKDELPHGPLEEVVPVQQSISVENIAEKGDLIQSAEIPSDGTSPVIIEKPTEAAWEEDLYDDDEDDEEDEDEIPDENPREYLVESAQNAVSPPATISIPLQVGNVPPLVSAHELEELRQNHEKELEKLRSQIQDVSNQLSIRESQIAQKSELMASIISSHEAEKDELRLRIKETKEEAKRRISKAKERVEALERSSMKNSVSAEDIASKDETINALREEGQKLALKQSEMEKAVRSALTESRELMALLDEERAKKEKATEKAASLESDLKRMKEELVTARKGESQASKLESELQSLKEEADRKDASNLLLQQQIKELKAEMKELRQGMDAMQKDAIIESKRENDKLKKEHSDLLAEMEMKLRACERDASVREDALRSEVAELRKRWQDAVRRADALSMDVQNSTAPLLRQLESIERQNRVRAATWAELETKLRTDMENLIIENEKLTKERNEYKSISNRLSRVSKERDDELSACKGIIEDQKLKIVKQEALIEKMETEGKKMKEEWSEVERLANEGVSKVRSDMMTTVLESEERHQAQLKSIENELAEERKIRHLLERQVEGMLENAGMMVVPMPSSNATVLPSSVQKKLRSADSQGSILTDAISGLHDDDEDADDEFDGTGADVTDQAGKNSFAAIEQLSQRLKESKIELEALRLSLASADRVRASLLEELSSARIAKEKLPLFEAKVQELALENREKEMEILALKEDIADIRHLYRGQLNLLIEEKAATLSESSDLVKPEDLLTAMHDPSTE